MTATRSPAETPSAARPFASRLTRSPSSPKLVIEPPKRQNGLSESSRARRATSSPIVPCAATVAETRARVGPDRARDRLGEGNRHVRAHRLGAYGKRRPHHAEPAARAERAQPRAQ